MDSLDSDSKELAKLIEAQRNDMRLGPFQRPQPGTIHFGTGTALDDLTEDGFVKPQRAVFPTLRILEECAIHGRPYVRETTRKSRTVCSKCEWERQQKWRKDNADHYREMENARRRKRYAEDEAYRERRKAEAKKQNHRRRAKAAAQSGRAAGRVGRPRKWPGETQRERDAAKARARRAAEMAARALESD